MLEILDETLGIPIKLSRQGQEFSSCDSIFSVTQFVRLPQHREIRRSGGNLCKFLPDLRIIIDAAAYRLRYQNVRLGLIKLAAWSLAREPRPPKLQVPEIAVGGS